MVDALLPVAMGVFVRLRAGRLLQRRLLPLLETIEDFDLVMEIGYHQEIKAPLTPKALALLGIGASATLERRLRRLRQLGLVVERRSATDRRTVQLFLSPKVSKVYAQYAALVGRDGALKDPGVRPG